MKTTNSGDEEAVYIHARSEWEGHNSSPDIHS